VGAAGFEVSEMNYADGGRGTGTVDQRASPWPDGLVEGFILPGATPASGALDLARAITRRAERRCLALERQVGVENPQIRRWLNRLSLLLFVLARFEENLAGSQAPPAKTSRRSSD